MENDTRDLVPSALGDITISFSDEDTPYQPDMVTLGDVVGAKLGSLIMVWRE